MTIDEAKEHFRTGYNLKKVTGLAHNSFRNWSNIGFIPALAQLKLEHYSEGKLKADKGILDEHKKYNKVTAGSTY